MRPVKVIEHPWGLGLAATADVPAGDVIARFEGPVVPWAQVPDHEVRHVLLVGPDQWLIPSTDARLVNHACDPNCVVDDADQVVTLRPVAAGEEFSIAYNVVHGDEDPGPWDPRWSFACACGAACCQGRIDGYVRRVHDRWERVGG